MLAAYFLVLLFALPVGIIAGLYRRPRQIILPLLDILQSIPVLGYLPAALFLFTTALPSIGGFELGYELAAVFLIFTGMAWSVVFAVISAVRNMPDDMREASNCFGMRGWRFIRNIILPLIIPSLVTGSILAWGGGWYFLAAAEILTYGAAPHSLPGLGAYLGNAFFKYNNIPSALFGLIVFISVIYTLNQMVWKPLSAWARRYRIQNMQSITTEAPMPSSIVLAGLTSLFHLIDPPLNARIERLERLIVPRLRPTLAPFIHVPRRKRHLPLPWYKQGTLYGVLFIAVMLSLAYFFSAALTAPLYSFEHSIGAHPEVAQLPELAAFSFLRIFIAYILALAWTLVAAIAVTRSRLLSDIFFPIFDIGQSTPALALFPFIVLIVIRVLGGGGPAVEVASILLLLTGAQWYLLFNIMGAIRNIPGDILEASRAFGLKDWDFYRQILLPAILPGILLGSIQAWGGAWNASIVSEYINANLQVPGLGSFLTAHTLAANPDPWIITLAVACMTLVVLLLNALVWKPLFAYAERFKFQN
jgi:NitT/TauT family transport system permease protein